MNMILVELFVSIVIPSLNLYTSSDRKTLGMMAIRVHALYGLNRNVKYGLAILYVITGSATVTLTVREMVTISGIGFLLAIVRLNLSN